MTNGKITPEEFTLRAIEKLRVGQFRGIHNVYQGYNAAFRSYFPDLGNDGPIKTVNEMARKGSIRIVPTKGGVRLYLPADLPSSSPALNPKTTLAKMGL